MTIDPAETPEELDYTLEDLTPEQWIQCIAYFWRNEWTDPREDIYTWEDGRPENEAREKP